jgi:YD repeat-containing protein
VVERRDTRTKRLTDRLVYAGTQLVTNEHVVSAHTRAITTLTWDEKNRLREKTTCFSAGAGEPDWAPKWRPPMAVYEQALTQHSRTRITYDGESSRPAFAQLDSTAGESGSRMKLCYAYDEQGRRARRIQTFRDQTPASLQVESRKYTWSDQRLASIDYRSVALKERSVAGRGQYRVAFAYDDEGRVIEQTVTHANQPPSSVRLKYEHGRLVSYGDVTLQWDAAGRLTGLLDGRFEWDESGRIKSATFEHGEGFFVTYGAACAAGFSPPAVTPSVDGYLFYEGKDEL